MIVLQFNVGDWVRIIEPNIKARINKITITHEVMYHVEYWEDKNIYSACCYEDEIEHFDGEENHEKNIVVVSEKKVNKNGK